MLRSPLSSRLLRLAGVAAPLALVACSALVSGRVQGEIDRYWFDPATNGQAEDDAERELKTRLDAQLTGQEFEVPGPNPYLHHIKGVRVELGKKSPQFRIPGQVTVTQTATHYYLRFDWEADWPRDNGAEIDVACDMRSHSFFLAYGYPDHTVELRRIQATSAGSALVVLPKAGGGATASVTLGSATVDLAAGAEGWFWTVDVSGQVRGQVRDAVLRDLIGKSVSKAFQAPAIPTLP